MNTDNSKSPILSKNVSSSNGLEPLLRFRSFSDFWHKNFLEDLGIFMGGGTPSKSEEKYWNGSIPWISSSDMTEDSVTKINISRYINHDAIDNSATKLCPKNTIHIVSRVGVGKVAISHIQLCTSQDFTNFISNDLNNRLFLTYYLSVIMKKKSQQTQGTSIKGITSEEIKKLRIFLPSLPEQKKIAEFLFLVDERIEQQRKLVEALKRYKRGVINKVLSSIKQTDMVLLKDLVTKGHVKLGRGNVIPKYKKDESKIYPVYSSSTHNDGLMGFYDSFMFDNELITWSIDGGGNFFYRKKHKFNVTNVCGILELDSTQYNYKFIAECLIHQHERKHFDYLSKAHPSVIIDMYKLPNISIDVQQKYATLFLAFDDLIIASEQVVDNLRQVKTALLQQMFI